MSVPEVTFHKLAAEHLDEVLDIERQSFKTPWSKFAFLHEMQFEKSVFKVLKIDSRVIGYGGFWLVLDEAHISNIAIHPEFRRRGLGRKLLINLLVDAVSRGATKASLEVRRSNVAAQRLYEGFGFAVVSVRKRYYVDENEDALIMLNEDIPSALAAARAG
ncbi:MAG: ribosomal-protein-alanine N-acetyltransferase [Candidatus Abyssobacteria bacterium SURF_17]|uniref:Ribosomal-protein-alanine N-acetyltransferase n=1 Tax=Candidatus Abyssobacteria bacterium SURF_17 TaxID=2093361 RepID=A0A419F402_9BACT|nr:MAG: ribosomal-protein-alanine N-acetyltransferase [Candidatus Abyssubacteria bacterium SURF_17]